MFERGAAGDCVVRCPQCDSDDFLTVRFYSIAADSDPQDETWVGCKRCEKWFVEAEGKWAYAAWNDWACQRWRSEGVQVPHCDLYQLLAEEAKTEKASRAQLQLIRSRIDEYVDRHVLAESGWKVGDRFEAKGWRKGVWSVASIEARYTINRGLIWIMKARSVLPSGSLGDDIKEFWSGDERGMRRLPPFWTPRRWDQVYAGDDCLLGGKNGSVVAIYSNPRSAEVRVDGQLTIVQRLSELMVPVARVENREQ